MLKNRLQDWKQGTIGLCLRLLFRTSEEEGDPVSGNRGGGVFVLHLLDLNGNVRPSRRNNCKQRWGRVEKVFVICYYSNIRGYRYKVSFSRGVFAR